MSESYSDSSEGSYKQSRSANMYKNYKSGKASGKEY